jgi:hypothetical protein
VPETTVVQMRQHRFFSASQKIQSAAPVSTATTLSLYGGRVQCTVYFNAEIHCWLWRTIFEVRSRMFRVWRSVMQTVPDRVHSDAVSKQLPISDPHLNTPVLNRWELRLLWKHLCCKAGIRALQARQVHARRRKYTAKLHAFSGV